MERNRGGRPRHPDVLTPAEWRVLEALREGGTNAEIAARLAISPDAVKYHISNMLGKLDLQGRHELAAWRPEAERRRLGAVFAVPAVLAYVVRPLVWVGLGTVAAAGVAGAVVAAVAVVAVVLVGVPDGGEPSAVVGLPVATPEATSTLAPTPTVTPRRQRSPQSALLLYHAFAGWRGYVRSAGTRETLSRLGFPPLTMRHRISANGVRDL